jgi:hypothetical protein
MPSCNRTPQIHSPFYTHCLIEYLNLCRHKKIYEGTVILQQLLVSLTPRGPVGTPQPPQRGTRRYLILGTLDIMRIEKQCLLQASESLDRSARI